MSITAYELFRTLLATTMFTHLHSYHSPKKTPLHSPHHDENPGSHQLLGNEGFPILAPSGKLLCNLSPRNWQSTTPLPLVQEGQTPTLQPRVIQLFEVYETTAR